MIFSRKTRDWSPENKDSYSEELMGTSQFLTSKQIQHTFILDDALLNQDLSRFPVILAPGLECISDKQAEKLRNYVKGGGTLFLTGEACRFSSYGEPRRTWIFEDMIPEKQMKNTSDTSLSEIFYGKGRIIYSPERYGLNEFCSSFTLGDNYRFIPDPDSQWERIKEDMIFEISIPLVSYSYYSTPDNPGHRSVGVEKISEGRYRITVPEGTVDKYGIIYLYQ